MRTMTTRKLSPVDRAFQQLDQAVRTVLAPPPPAARPNPAAAIPDQPLTDRDRRHAAGLMRVNHAGEIMAQGLYQGQALTARLDTVRDAMEQAASEEFDHLAWCEQRLTELRDRPSVLARSGTPALSCSAQARASLATAGASASSPRPRPRSSATSRITSAGCRQAIGAAVRSSSR
jgi:hypothetical protein